MKIEILPSSRNDKKFMARVDEKTIHFGAKGYQDFTTHKDPKRKERYLARHKERENWTKPDTAGFYARWVFWNKPTLADSVRDMNQRFPAHSFHLTTP